MHPNDRSLPPRPDASYPPARAHSAYLSSGMASSQTPKKPNPGPPLIYVISLVVLSFALLTVAIVYGVRGEKALSPIAAWILIIMLCSAIAFLAGMAGRHSGLPSTHSIAYQRNEDEEMGSVSARLQPEPYNSPVSSLQNDYSASYPAHTTRPKSQSRTQRQVSLLT